MAKDRELQDHERAHSGRTGSKVRHGADAVGKVVQLHPRKDSDYDHMLGGVSDAMKDE